jgi:hypothetical protein
MNITPNIKNTAIYTFIYGLFTWVVLVSTIIDYSDRALLVVILLTISVNIIRFALIARKDINFKNNKLYINGTLVSVLHKNKRLDSLWLDSIEYESTPWKKKNMGSLSHYMFAKEQWALVTSNTKKNVSKPSTN